MFEPADDWVELDPPPAWYHDVWDTMVDCTGFDDGPDFNVVRWFTVDRPWLDWHGEKAHGLAYIESNFILMLECWADVPETVAHESIHLLAGLDELDFDHEAWYWTCPSLVADYEAVKICLSLYL